MLYEVITHFLWEDLLSLLADLREHGFDFDPVWFEAQATIRQGVERLRAEIVNLPSQYRAVIELRHFQEMRNNFV